MILDQFELRFVHEVADGEFFNVKFIKKNGDERSMTARRGVKTYTQGIGMAYNPAEKGLLGVWDTQAEGGEQHAYRMVNLKSVFEYTAHGETHRR